jgi:hypothetical protein
MKSMNITSTTGRRPDCAALVDVLADHDHALVRPHGREERGRDLAQVGRLAHEA